MTKQTGIYAVWSEFPKVYGSSPKHFVDTNVPKTPRRKFKSFEGNLIVSNKDVQITLYQDGKYEITPNWQGGMK